MKEIIERKVICHECGNTWYKKNMEYSEKQNKLIPIWECSNCTTYTKRQTRQSAKSKRLNTLIDELTN